MLFSSIFRASWCNSASKMLQRAVDGVTVWHSWTLLVFFVDIIRCCGSAADTWQNLKLPDEHIPYFFNNNNHLKTMCEIDPNCPHKVRYPHILLFLETTDESWSQFLTLRIHCWRWGQPVVPITWCINFHKVVLKFVCVTVYDVVLAIFLHVNCIDH